MVPDQRATPCRRPPHEPLDGAPQSQPWHVRLEVKTNRCRTQIGASPGIKMAENPLPRFSGERFCPHTRPYGSDFSLLEFIHEV